MTEHVRTIPPWWFAPLWSGDTHCVFLLDERGDELHAGHTVVMHEKYSRRRLRGDITHIYSGKDFAERNMTCVSFGRVVKLEDKAKL